MNRTKNQHKEKKKANKNKPKTYLNKWFALGQNWDFGNPCEKSFQPDSSFVDEGGIQVVEELLGRKRRHKDTRVAGHQNVEEPGEVGIASVHVVNNLKMKKCE